MSILVGISAVFSLLLAGSFVMIFRRLAATTPSIDGDWLCQLAENRYRPLERLLDERDYRALRAHPACTRKMLRHFRAGRVKAFRGYLKCLSSDFGRVCTAIKLLMVQSAHDRPDLAALLVRQRARFTYYLMLTEFRLCLHGLGIGAVDTAGLVAALENMRVELNGLLASPSVAPAAA